LVDGRLYSFVVDERELHRDLLRVALVHQEGDRALVQLPAGEPDVRIAVPLSMLVNEPPPGCIGQGLMGCALLLVLVWLLVLWRVVCVVLELP
jgi:hypothetical protein